MTRPSPAALRLYSLSVIGSGLGFVCQTLVSGFWSTAYSHDVLHFSVNLAFYFLSMGIGSLVSGRLPARVEMLGSIVGVQALWTGLSVPLLRTGTVLLGEATLLPILAVSVSGLLAGAIVPLTVRAGARMRGVSLQGVLFFDYLAAVIFTLLFTLVLLVPLGYGATGALTAGLAGIALAATLWPLRQGNALPATLAAAAVLLPWGVHKVSLSAGTALNKPGESMHVLINKQSHYQKIVMTEETGRGSFFPGIPVHVLYLDGFVQFSSIDEQTYHACIANIPEAAAEYNQQPAREVLILGGGDGLAARNLLTMPKISRITLVELDPAMIGLARNHPLFRRYNLDSLRSPRVKIVVADAFQWVRRADERFDLILVDFPHPKNISLARLYTAEFFSHVARLLRPRGFAAIQAGPSLSLDDPSLRTLSPVPLTVRETARAVGLNAHVYVSPRDEEAFVLATPDSKFDMSAFARQLGITGMSGMGLVCTYDESWRMPAGKVQVNTLNTLSLAGVMLEWYRKAGQQAFFNYRGVQAAFLPD